MSKKSTFYIRFYFHFLFVLLFSKVTFHLYQKAVILNGRKKYTVFQKKAGFNANH